MNDKDELQIQLGKVDDFMWPIRLIIPNKPAVWEVSMAGVTVSVIGSEPVPNALQRWLQGLLGIKSKRVENLVDKNKESLARLNERVEKEDPYCWTNKEKQDEQ